MHLQSTFYVNRNRLDIDREIDIHRMKYVWLDR